MTEATLARALQLCSALQLVQQAHDIAGLQLKETISARNRANQAVAERRNRHRYEEAPPTAPGTEQPTQTARGALATLEEARAAVLEALSALREEGS